MATKEQLRARKRFSIASRLEKEYVRQLRFITRNIDTMVKSMPDEPNYLIDLLNRYSALIDPWAKSVVKKMMGRIADKDADAWIQLGKDMNKSLHKELNETSIGYAFQGFMNEQVRLIKSLPIDAAKRVHKLTIEGVETGRRAEDIAKDILATGKVIESRAQLIARTEVARTASAITKARSEKIGATHYYWRTCSDADVRIGHKEMNGKICEWANPPAVNEGTEERPHIMYHHPGMIWNCRCYAEPIIEWD